MASTVCDVASARESLAARARSIAVSASDSASFRSPRSQWSARPPAEQRRLVGRVTSR